MGDMGTRFGEGPDAIALAPLGNEVTIEGGIKKVRSSHENSWGFLHTDCY